MSITINSNIASLNTQRRFAKTTEELQDSFSRLSSGLRINRARDDAAGLSIASDLKVDSLVYGQAVRNTNDAISLLNIAEGATQELSSIVIRQRELASQAANGTLSRQQRKALNEEANALVDEFNRIVESTSFNSETLLVAGKDPIRIQAGYGEDGGFAVGVAQELARTVGDGTYQDFTDIAPDAGVFHLATADINNDGNQDILSNNFGATDLSVMLGNGDGTFKGQVTYDFGANRDKEVADFNGDGVLDVIGVNNGTSALFMALGNGDGTFKAATSIAAPSGGDSLRAEDFNGDGAIDLVVDGSFADDGYVFLNDGAANFSVKQNLQGVGNIKLPEVDDLNDDGIFDLVAGVNSGQLQVFLGNADGSFAVGATYATSGAGQAFTLTLGDFDGDKKVDIVSAEYGSNSLSFLKGNGDGSFGAATAISSFNTPVGIRSADINGDGNLDFAVTFETDNSFGVYLGKGDGTFETPVSYAAGTTTFSLNLEDYNNDGALDIATGSNGGAESIKISLANTTTSSRMDYLDLRTAARAKSEMAVLDETLIRINQELGGIGASQSRLAVAVGNLQVGKENYTSAASRIEDVDVAQESARLVRGQILQQAGAAILGQANQEPALALALLSGI